MFQLLYKNAISYDENIMFYDEQIQRIMKCNKKYHMYLFEEVKTIIQEMNIEDKILDEFLRFFERLWETRYEKVKDFSWFDQFGNRMSNFKILYVQWLLSGKKIDYSSRFEFQNQLYKSLEGSDVNSFCEEYFRLTNQVESLFSKDMESDEAKDIQLSVEYLLDTGRIDISSFIYNLPVLSLLCLESIVLKGFYNNRNNYLVEVFLTPPTLGGKNNYLIREGMVEFYTLKMVCGLYDSLYQNEKFIDLFKINLKRHIDSSNKTIVQYVESIAEKVNGFETISYLMKKEIIYRINKMLFY